MGIYVNILVLNTQSIRLEFPSQGFISHLIYAQQKSSYDLLSSVLKAA